MAGYKNTVISNLHEMKSSYQRNMLVGTLASAVLALIIGLLLINGSSPEVRSNTGVVFAVPPLSVSGGGEFATGYKSGRPRFNPYAHRGFAGFNGYTVVKYDAPIVVMHSGDRFVEESLAETLFANSVPSDPTGSFGIGDGYGYGFGFPERHSLIDLADALYPPHIDFTSSIESPAPDEPAYIKLTQMPRISSEYFGKGSVTVEFVIRKNGEVIDRAVREETPTGFGASDSLFSALGEAFFWAAKTKGKKVDTRIIFTWKYCQGDGCGDYNTVTYGGQRVIVRDDSPHEREVDRGTGSQSH